MSAPILLTKHFIPANRPELVSRSRLIEQLNRGLHRKLTLISAPAGFGKTTMVTDWLESQGDDASSPFLVAWLSLDDGDNDPVRFLTYFVSALNRLQGLETEIGVGALQMLQAPQPPSPETILITLINELALAAIKIVLVLDDYHHIDNQLVHDGLIFLLENLPPQLHLVITTREDPPLQISRLRTRGQLTELRAIQLRFSTAETYEFLNEMMELDLAAEDIAALEKRTEGWVAGLHLAAISMRGRTDISSFIQSFTGSHHFVIDYLVEEVLEHQPGPIRDFLLRTSILSRLTGDLCDTVTGQENGQETLETLERANLFIIPLDDKRRWYRYHHLFADLLYQRLRTTSPDLVKELHSKAVTWHDTNGELSAAIHHAFVADDIDTAARLIEKGALRALEQSDLKFILNGVDRLPDGALNKHPWLFVYHTWALMLTGQLALVSSRLENSDWLLDSFSYSDEKKQEMMGFIAGLKAIQFVWLRDFENGVYFANQALQYLPKNNWIRGYCAMVLGANFWGGGDLSRAKDAFQEAYLVGEASGNPMLVVSGGCNLAYAIELEGDLQKAFESFQDLLKFTEQDGKVAPAAGYIYVDLARLFHELNQLELANQHLIDGIQLCQQLADGRAETIGHGLLTLVQLARGDFTGAFNSVQNARDSNPSPETSLDLRGGDYPEIWLWLKNKDYSKLSGWLDDNRLEIDEGTFFHRMAFIMHARVLITLGREYSDTTYVNDSLELLDRLLEMAQANNWETKVVKILALKSLAYDANGNKDLALSTLNQALSIAEPEGYIRSFVDEGPAMAKLLYEALSRKIAPEYVQKLLAAFPETATGKDTVTQSSQSTSEFIEPLSDRELEVLQLIADGLSRQEIAARLVLSLNTVKTHARNIFSKLGVKNQMQAVGKARGRGLLDKD